MEVTDIGLGISIGMIGTAVLFISMLLSQINNGTFILPAELHQKVLDCQQKDYYYLDNHRTLCDNLGVTPYNNTLSEKR